MANLDIFQFHSSTAYLQAVWQQKRGKNHRFSVRGWARQLSENPMSLLRILKGTRRCQLPLAEKLIQHLQMTTDEAEYFRLLVMADNSKSSHEQRVYFNLMQKLQPEYDALQLEADQFSFIAEWYHLPILEMTQLKDFSNEPAAIAERLGHGVTVTQVREALQRLKRLGLLRMTTSGGLQRIEAGRVKAGDAGPNVAVRHYHHQMLKMAQQILSQSSSEERDFTAYSMPMKKSNLQRVKKLVREFHRELAEFAAKGDGDEVFQMNFQFFPITGR